MDKEGFLASIKLAELREDQPSFAEFDAFWDNVPQKKDDYVITARVEGV